MQYQQVYPFIIDKLINELPAHLTYHDVQHTKDVVEAANYMATKETIGEQETSILLTAALFHDVGFTAGYDEHETLSCEVARKILPTFEYNASEIEKICKLIMVTKLPQKPTNILEEILCDADLFYLGSEKYFERAEQLHAELKANKKIKADIDWNKVQIDFLKKHRYFTLTAIKEQDKK
jgi:HD superfamily phosphodiesterase